MSEESQEIAELPRRDDAIRDGIGEEDNEIPLWFNVSFYGSMVFGVVYAAFYLFSGWSQEGQYEAEVARFEARFADVRAAQVASGNPYRGDPSVLPEGEAVFNQICAVCHKADGQGLVGPSLVDPYWKYGSDDAALYASVAEGRPGGMPPWGAQLGSEKIWKTLAYMETLPRTEEPGVGAPEAKPAASPGG